MRNSLLQLILMMVFAAIMPSCSDDYIIGGEINETNKVGVSSFDYLKMTEETDTVAILFEKAGLKDAVNGDVTIIAPNQWSVNRYIRRRHNQDLRNDPAAPELTISDLTSDDLTQMGMYILPGSYASATIPSGGINLTALDGSEVRLTVDETNTDAGSVGYQYSNFMEKLPKIVHVHFKRGNNWELTAEERTQMTNYYDNPECDHVYRMYVSDVITTTGVVHVLYSGDYTYSDHYYYHCLFFFGKRTDDTF